MQVIILGIYFLPLSRGYLRNEAEKEKLLLSANQTQQYLNTKLGFGGVKKSIHVLRDVRMQMPAIL